MLHCYFIEDLQVDHRDELFLCLDVHIPKDGARSVEELTPPPQTVCPQRSDKRLHNRKFIKQIVPDQTASLTHVHSTWPIGYLLWLYQPKYIDY